MFPRMSRLFRAAPKINKSRLENLFATNEEPTGPDKVLLNRKAHSRPSLYVTVTILVYAGQRAARLRDAIKMTKDKYAGASVEEKRNITCEFDQIFVETAALCFWSVMNKYWEGDVGDFWVEDESSDWEYLETLRDAFDLADSVITATTSPMLHDYLHAQVNSYMTGDANDSSPAMERFTRSICTWTLHRATDNPPDSITRIVTAFCLKTIGDINRPELDALCHLAYARTL